MACHDMTEETNPYLKRMAAKSKSAHGLKSEKRLSKTFKGAKLQPGSGAIDGAKGDIRISKFLIESKSTINESYSLKHEILQKIGREALDVNSHPALTVSFTDKDGKAKPQGDWILLPLYAFHEMNEQ